MNYVSDIILNGDHLDVLTDLDNHVFSVEVDGGEWIPIDALNSKHYLGYTSVGIGGTVVKHTSWQAKMYEYIDSIEMNTVRNLGEPVGDFTSALLNNGVVSSVGPAAGSDTLRVTLMGCSFMFYGHLGSVVHRQAGRSATWHSLYNVLAVLCREAKFCLMKYRNLEINSPTIRRLTRIQFSSSAEADVYFTKMFLMEVSRS